MLTKCFWTQATGTAIVLVNLCPLLSAQNPVAVKATQTPKEFNNLCQGCHGENTGGGDRAPALVNNPELRTWNEGKIVHIIKNGTGGGMPAFPLPEGTLLTLARWIRSLNLSAFDASPSGDASAGERFFFGAGQCARCHMVHGRGKVAGPDLSDIGHKATVRELELVLNDPTSQRGMHTTATCPSWSFCPDEGWTVVDVDLKDGGTLRGFARNRTEHEIQLQTFDGKLHLLSDADYKVIAPEKRSYMPPLRSTSDEKNNLIAYLSRLGGNAIGPLAFEVDPVPDRAIESVIKPQVGEWPTYNGVAGGNRHSVLSQVNKDNVKDLKLEWISSLEGTGLETTPIISDGVMYVSGPGSVCALDARSGHAIWCYETSSNEKSKASPVGSETSSTLPNRGVAILGDRIFFVTGDAHLLCLHRSTGGVLWEISMAGESGRFSAGSAPLVIGDLVVSGIAGGDGPLRGFLSAYKVTTGELVWRFWTIPKPGEPASETWTGNAIGTGGGATWATGSYDVETGTLYWAVGNPFPATDGDQRGGDNLYTNCVVALDGKTGKLLWHYQFTPHDLHDWDATEPLVLADAVYQGRARKLLLQANRNGFVYVLDRANGKLLLAKPFVKKLNWASGIGEDGRPQLLPANTTTKAGVKTCPAVRGATNWYSTAFNPETNLFYLMAVEDCSIYKQAHDGGYEGYRDPSDPGLRYFRAFDIPTGKIAWEIPQIGAQEANYSGVLSTAGGLVFYGETGGGFAAIDAETGRLLWRFKANEPWKASPMTYMLNGRQHVAIASGSNILSFALPDR